MKFSDGMWQVKPGFTLEAPACSYCRAVGCPLGYPLWSISSGQSPRDDPQLWSDDRHPVCTIRRDYFGTDGELYGCLQKGT